MGKASANATVQERAIHAATYLTIVSRGPLLTHNRPR